MPPVKDVHSNDPGARAPAKGEGKKTAPNRPGRTNFHPDPLVQDDEAAGVAARPAAAQGQNPDSIRRSDNDGAPSSDGEISDCAPGAQRDSGTPQLRHEPSDVRQRVYGALDLGTNNCRLLLARPTRRGFRVIDAFSRIIRLGEGVSQTGRLSEGAMRRTIEALKVCASKIRRHNVARARLVATEACRVAKNGETFLERVRDEVGLEIELLTRESEARYAVSGCASLIDVRSEHVLVFDIGGGSSELIWLDLRRRQGNKGRAFADRLEAQDCMTAWISLPVGVVTLAEHFGGDHVSPENFEEMVLYVQKRLEPFEEKHGFRGLTQNGRAHLLGTSGTVTTVAGIQLGLARYDRNRVDGCWLTVDDAREVTQRLLNHSYEERVAEPCIGRERADLVLAGCAILEALIRLWPCERMRVADRGLREGILATLMNEDGVHRILRRRYQGRGANRIRSQN